MSDLSAMKPPKRWCHWCGDTLTAPREETPTLRAERLNGRPEEFCSLRCRNDRIADRKDERKKALMGASLADVWPHHAAPQDGTS